VTACRTNAVLVMKALGADEVMTINETDIEKELEMHDKYESSQHDLSKLIFSTNLMVFS